MNDRIQYAIRLLNEMEYEQGIDILKDILTEDPENDVALYNLALAYNSINEPEKAIKTFDLYLEHHEKDSNVLAGLGYSYYLNRDIEKAKEILEEAVELNPENIYALRNLSGVLANLGDTEKAEKLFKQILAIDPKDYPVETRQKLYPLWVHGIITQLTSMPEDARIEKWIFDNYPELWKSQQQALEKQSNDIQSVVGPEIKSMTPEFIYNASGIINLFYIKSINNIIGPAALKALKKTSFYEKGMEVYSGITEIMKKEDTLANSIEITNYLAKTLGFESWFRWQDFENIPAGYEDAIAY